jgi:hypothetical protein
LGQHQLCEQFKNPAPWAGFLFGFFSGEGGDPAFVRCDKLIFSLQLLLALGG